MGVKRPYRVTYHYDAGRITPSGQFAEQAIDATSSSHELTKVRNIAREVSRRGGNARVWVRDPLTGEDHTLRTYEAYEVAIEDIIQETSFFPKER